MTTTVAWLLLVIAGLLEIAWAIGIKYTDGFTRLLPSLFTVGTATASFFLLAQAVKVLPVGTAYAIWVGIGAVGVAIFGMFVFHEPIQGMRIFFLALVITGIIGLKMYG
jgi:quaternary ammonium compound-resistance protein SugE